MDIKFFSFNKPSIEQYAELLNSPPVRRHMPLSSASYSKEWIASWVISKSNTWRDSRRGPWSVWIQGEFAGWAGVEPSGTELSFGICLLKTFWGHGAEVIDRALQKIKSEFPGVTRVLIELPTSRKSELYASRLGLQPHGSIEIDGHSFVTYRKYIY